MPTANTSATLTTAVSNCTTTWAQSSAVGLTGVVRIRRRMPFSR